ncbi:MAG: PIN domain-containing protein [Deltaproteobacteria bacterium]
MRRHVNSLPDTNAIVRYLVKDEPNLFKRAKDFFDQVKGGSEKAIILESVIAECIYVLTKIYKVPKKKAADSLIDILHYKGIINEDREELIAALNAFANSGLDIVDCILWAKSNSGMCRLFSFDEDLNRFVGKK